MKRLPAAVCLLLSLSGIAHAAFGIFQTYLPAGGTFNPTVVATEAHVFGMDPSVPANYLVPGNGAPAISTATYYNMGGLFGLQVYNLDDMGATGAAIKAANGGRGYVWVTGADHPTGGYFLRGGQDFVAGFSYQPWDLPEKLTSIVSTLNGWQTTPQYSSVPATFVAYEYPTIGYNPDDPDGLPIYLWMETGPQHFSSVWRTNDFVTFTMKEISHINSTNMSLTRWGSFVRYYKRNGANDFTTIATSTVSNAGSTVIFSKYGSTNGIDYTTSFAPILGMPGSPDAAGSEFYLGTNFTVGSQLYGIGREDATGGGSNQYVSIWPMDSTTFDKQSSPSKVRVASGWGNSNFPGPAYLQDVRGYVEDGLVYALPLYGYPSDISTSPGQGSPYGAFGSGGGLDQQFVDKLVVRVDDVAARLAAPVGMGISAASGTATITWKNALPQNTYRLYRGTNATTQATLIGDYTGVTSATDSPATGRYWYKLVTLDGGTERKSRVLSVYVSSSSAFINKHVNGVADDGGDLATCNFPFMDRADAMLDTAGIRSILEIWTHPAFCVKHTAGVISKIYDLGSTYLPRSDNYKTTTSATTYSATSVNTGPGWTNANNNSYGYWGDRNRGNTINQKRQITILAAYERTQTTDDLTFMATGPIFNSDITGGTSIIALKHTAGSPGNISFSLSDATSTKTATVAANGSGMQIAIGTYDGSGGTGMIAWSNTTSGTPVTTLDPNPNFGDVSIPGANKYILGALAGSRNVASGGCCPDFLPSPFPAIYPVLGLGSVHNYTLLRNPIGGPAPVYTFTETNAKGKFQTVMYLGGAINSTQIGQLNTFLQSTTNW